MRVTDLAKMFVCFLARGKAVGHGIKSERGEQRRGKKTGREKKKREGRMPVGLQMAHASTNTWAGAVNLFNNIQTSARVGAWPPRGFSWSWLRLNQFHPAMCCGCTCCGPPRWLGPLWRSSGIVLLLFLHEEQMEVLLLGCNPSVA